MKRLVALPWYSLPLLFLAAVVVSACSAAVLANPAGTGSSGGTLDLSLDPFATGLSGPVGLANAGDSRLFAVERAGRIKVIQSNGTVLPTPFLDITDRVDDSDSEEGLLGLVFHPDYANNGYFYVNYTNTTSGTRRSRISRFSVTADPNVADPDSEEILLTILDPNWNHNAGHILFGPDGYLYIPMGDGGGAGDTSNNAQNLTLLLGKVSRIDVDNGPGDPPDCVGLGTGNYTVPTSNPLNDGAGGTCDEIWAIGLRNPWRSSFDRLTDDFFIGDVGQGSWEEIDFQPAASTGGENYGWRCYEGNHPYNTTGCGPIGNYTFPIFEYSHSGSNCTVIGGYVYRGSTYPAMVGRYLLADYCSGNFWDLAYNGSTWTPTLHTNLTEPFSYVAFAEDLNGELYVVDIGGIVYRLEENTIVITPTPSTTPTVTSTSTPTTTPTITPTPSDFMFLPVVDQEK
ncbi:MAG: PQQ-dependent sugar dehydrogenase [Chloroflexi bacterium]|nr:PQQ-dependent sugar dehydrogenase [Chloroflexota bacterium]MCI0578039.1 PQQ-dependent sugar dehydrogenase [Chloroflexota bacterium]MCI0644747.1 PQQ-dependent sugar dehydrogenase [Chloroflexota bacterium]MCI0728652.1 PQQ-dependent sugar dehydrogenase [Chloroflexota bacterium]